MAPTVLRSMDSKLLQKYHEISDVCVTETELQLTIDGAARTFPLAEVSALVANADRVKRELVEVSPSGYGLHWPLLDEDVSVDGLLGVRHQPSGRKRLA